VRFLVVVWVWFLGYLDDGDVEERAAEADGEGGGGHDGRAGQEPHGHGERRHLVPARDDPRLQRHEQPCTKKATPRWCQSVTREHRLKIHLLFHRWTSRAAREHGPRLNMAMPRPASERIEMDLRMIAGISKFHLHARRAEQISEGPNRMERHW